MLKILIPTLVMLPVTWLSPPKWLYSTTTFHSMTIAVLSMMWIKKPWETGWDNLSPLMGADPLSTPLLVLSCWLLPLMILASQHHLRYEPMLRQRLFVSVVVVLQICLILAFGATEALMFYVMFEATLIPTLILITRWGNQAERLGAGTYFLFYTLAGSLPLLVALLVVQNCLGTTSFLALPLKEPLVLTSQADKLWWAACLFAFLVKLPLYGVHLWLPKAHVEAPVAGSMVLAAVLLKLGGYGILRMLLLTEPMTNRLAIPFIVLALWGILMTGMICLRQNDLKALIAYSSVSHMGLVVGGILIQTPWGHTGALILMIAHGLTSSALFCLANTNYERTHTRTMILIRGLQVTLPLMSAWWFFASLANLALPPLPNFMAELMIMSALFNWSWWTLLFTGLGTLITAAYSLYMFLMSQRGRIPPHITAIPPNFTREHLLIALHLIPLIAVILKPELLWSWL